MRIKSLKLQNYRRFTDLTITDVPESTKLVIMLGPNGTGKSSVFDGLLTHVTIKGHQGVNWDDFHQKKAELDRNAHNSIELLLHAAKPMGADDWLKAVYVRTAHRNDPDFSPNHLNEIPKEAFRDRHITRTIETDRTVTRNYARYKHRVLDDIFNRDNDTYRHQSIGNYADGLINKIAEPLSRILPKLRFESLGEPGKGVATFYFSKNGQPRFHFKNLSGGEKAAFDLILDMIVKREEYNDTVFCIDEPEAHLNPAVHGQCLEELFNLLPGNCQLWLATHSIGMLRRARDLARRYPEQIVFLDFDQNFDEQVTLRPVLMNRQLWDQVLKVAIDDLAALVAPERIMICEGGNTSEEGGIDENAFDAEIYNKIFADEFPETRFYGAGSHADTKKAKAILFSLSQSLMPALIVGSVIDRDDRSEREIDKIKDEGGCALDERNIEAYLYSDELLQKLCEIQKQPEKFQIITKKKYELLKEKNTKDCKKVSGPLYSFIKSELELRNSGNDTKAFMIDTLAPLMTTDTETYKKIRACILA